MTPYGGFQQRWEFPLSDLGATGGQGVCSRSAAYRGSFGCCGLWGDKVLRELKMPIVASGGTAGWATNVSRVSRSQDSGCTLQLLQSFGGIRVQSACGLRCPVLSSPQVNLACCGLPQSKLVFRPQARVGHYSLHLLSQSPLT